MGGRGRKKEGSKERGRVEREGEGRYGLGMDAPDDGKCRPVKIS